MVRWRLRHQPGLDGLRGIAVVAVVAYHAFPTLLPGGFAGVEVFFVLSGFLITALLIDEHDREARIGLRTFYIRRLRRLVPALVAMIAGVVVLMAVGARLGPLTGVVAMASYATNLILVYLPHQPVPFAHTWSLATEEQFYFVWPMIMIMLLRHQRTVCVAVTAFLAVAAEAFPVVGLAHGEGWFRLYYLPWYRAGGLMVGCLLAELVCFGIMRPRRPPAWLLSAVGALGGLWLLGAAHDARLPYAGGLLAIHLGTAAAVLAVLDRNSWLYNRALGKLGRISYPLYLWHPIMLFVVEQVDAGALATVAGIGMSVMAAALSERFVERPFLASRSKAQSGPRNEARMEYLFDPTVGASWEAS